MTTGRDAEFLYAPSGPPSGPVSGIVAPSLFRGEAGPGYWIRDDEAGVALAFDDEPGRAPCRVLRLSPTALWFVPAAGVDYPLESCIQVSLRAHGGTVGPLSGRIAAPPGPSRLPILGLALDDIPLGHARQIITLLCELSAAGVAHLAHRPPEAREEITDPARIHAVVRALAAVEGHGRLLGRAGDPTLHLVAVSDDGRVEWSGAILGGVGPFTVDILGYNSVYRLHLPDARLAGDRVETPLPTRVERVRHRAHRRGGARARLLASLRHPLWPGLPVISREVRDVSFGGIGFVTVHGDDLMFPGLSLPRIEISTDEGDRVRLHGEVRVVSSASGEDVCGVSVLPSSSRDEDAWYRLIALTLYPTTESGERFAEPVWELFERSGYFNLSGKSPERFVELKSSFTAVTAQTGVRPRIFGHAIFPSDRGVEATLSVTKAYQGSWCGHQLAKRPGAPPRDVVQHRILRDLYVRGFEHPQKDPDFKWFIAYLEASVPWNKKVHLGFAERHEGTGLAAVFPFRLTETSSHERSRGASAGGVEIRPASSADMGLLLGALTARRPPIFNDALDLVPSRIDLADVAQAWASAGFERSRRIVVARRDGVSVAAAILETGEPGTNLFRLLDGARLVALTSDGRAAYPALLDEARRFYAARGRESFVHFMEEDDEALLHEARLEDLGAGHLWILGARLIPDFLEHIYEVTTPRRSHES